MTYGAWEIVGQNSQQLPFGKTIGDALRDLVRSRFKNNAAKAIEARWNLDAKTAKNVVSSGHVSERTLTKAARAERWALWMALGEELFGQSYAEWEEQRLQTIIEEAERDLDRVRRLRPQGPALSERSFAERAVGVLDDDEGVEPAAGREGRGALRGADGGAGAQAQPLTAHAGRVRR
jgi:hypothetical protein